MALRVIQVAPDGSPNAGGVGCQSMMIPHFASVKRLCRTSQLIGNLVWRDEVVAVALEAVEQGIMIIKAQFGQLCGGIGTLPHVPHAAHYHFIPGLQIDAGSFHITSARKCCSCGGTTMLSFANE
jgi:hypothetical protein